MTGMLGTSASKLENLVLGTGLMPTGLEQSVSHTLALSQTIDSSLIGQAASHALGLSQTLVAGLDAVRSLTDAMTLVQSVQHSFPEQVSDDLGLTDAALAVKDLAQSLTSALALTQTPRSSIINVSVASTLGITDSADGRGPVYIAIHHNLNLTEPATSEPGPLAPRISDPLNLVSAAGRVLTASALSTLALTSDGHRFTGATSSLTLTDLASAGKGPSELIDSLLLVGAVAYTGLLNRSPVSTLTLSHAVAYEHNGSCLAKSYSPFVGGNSDPSYTPPSTAAPTLGNAVLTLTYPYASPTTTLVLRNADFGNNDKLAYTRINQQTRGGTLIVFADPQWPKVKTRTFAVSAICDDKRDAVLQFLEDSLGQEIGLLDWDNRQWRGIITNPDTAVTQAGRNDSSVSIEFEGDLA